MTRHAKYMLITAHPAKAFKHVMEFDVRTMQYEMTTTPFMLPSMGLKRVYTDATITPTDAEADETDHHQKAPHGALRLVLDLRLA